jgi:4-amino-4-deoxy-L-arabinose transferase-like glycosyltransferase
MSKKDPTIKANLIIDMKSNLPVYIGLITVLFIVRLPSFFFSVFDWDESTLILIGQSILNGYIPYVDAWDIKPPLSFHIYALFIFLFGKSIISIRIGGFLCIYIASILIYKTGEVIHNKTTGIISALFLIVFVSLGPSGLSTMTEHILLIPVSFIFYLLLTTDINKKLVFVIGITLGTAILIRTNMVFESFAVCIILLSGLLNPGTKYFYRIKRCFILIMGISIPIIFIVYYYFSNNLLDLLIKTNVTTIFTYTGTGEASFLYKAHVFIYNIEQNIRINLLLWTTFFFGTIYLIFLKKFKNKFLLISMIFFTTQILSLFMIGQPFGHHYLITSMPIMCLISGVALSQWLSENKIKKISCFITIMLIATGVIYSLQENIFKNYREIFSQLMRKQPLLNDSCYKITRFLKDADVKDQYIYMVNSCQIVYWLTENRYPTKYIHPSNLLLKEYMLKIIDGPNATKEKELLKILSKSPQFIIWKQTSWPQQLEDFKKILDNEIHFNYKLINTIDIYYHIYRRESPKQVK